MPDGLPFNFTDYLELIEWTGRVIREDKRGSIPSHLPDILQRLNIDPENWLTLTTELERKTQRFVGEADQIREATSALGYRQPPGISNPKYCSLNPLPQTQHIMLQLKCPLGRLSHAKSSDLSRNSTPRK